ncbi:hypothetical protein S7335_4432 [Synechococcus sp. PCC 7335]|nr:hypothetical protein S7335_4432 [Synechococcus sp. PCC 7335]
MVESIAVGIFAHQIGCVIAMQYLLQLNKQVGFWSFKQCP